MTSTNINKRKITKLTTPSPTLDSRLLSPTLEYTALYNFFSNPSTVLQILPSEIEEIRVYFAEYRRLVDAYEQVNGPVWGKELQERGPGFWEQRCFERAEDEAAAQSKATGIGGVGWEQLPSVGGQVGIGGILPTEEGEEEENGKEGGKTCTVM